MTIFSSDSDDIVGTPSRQTFEKLQVLHFIAWQLFQSLRSIINFFQSSVPLWNLSCWSCDKSWRWNGGLRVFWKAQPLSVHDLLRVHCLWLVLLLSHCLMKWPGGGNSACVWFKYASPCYTNFTIGLWLVGFSLAFFPLKMISWTYWWTFWFY